MVVSIATALSFLELLNITRLTQIQDKVLTVLNPGPGFFPPVNHGGEEGVSF